MSGMYILDSKGKPVEEQDVLKWGKWMEENKRWHKVTIVDHYEVSTVFLGVDYSFGTPVPVLYETMVFDTEERSEVSLPSGVTSFRKTYDFQARYHTQRQATIGHNKLVAELKKGNISILES